MADIVVTKLPFNIKADKQYDFFCEACLVGKHEGEASPDFRYCQACYDLLLKEVEMLTRGKRPAWSPNPQKAKIAGEKQYQVLPDVAPIMSTLKSKNIEVDKINPSVARVNTVKRGRKRQRLPEDIILELHKDGLGSKAIATQLKREEGVVVSYKTVQRVLSGQRN